MLPALHPDRGPQRDHTLKLCRRPLLRDRTLNFTRVSDPANVLAECAGDKSVITGDAGQKRPPRVRLRFPMRLRPASARAPRPKVLQGLTTWLPRLSSECALRCAQIRALAQHRRVPLAAIANSSASNTLAMPLDDARNHCVPIDLAKSAKRRPSAPPGAARSTVPSRRDEIARRFTPLHRRK